VLQVTDEKIPLSQDQGGNVYVTGTRVTLDCLVETFDHGASPEEMAEEYSSLALPDVYAVLTYYLRHQHEVKAHIARQVTASEEARRAHDAAFPARLREKLLRARQEREAGGREGPA
jgi:uncharacterized protein (DUF433 family)